MSEPLEPLVMKQPNTARASAVPAEAWTRIRGDLRNQIGKDACQNWIDPLEFLGADQGVGQFAAPTSFIGT